MSLTFQLVEKLWFNELGCEQSDLKPGRTAVFPHGTLKGYSGVIAFFRDDACIVSAPDYLVKELKEKLDHVDPKTAFTIDGLRSAIGARVERVIGPGWLASIVPQDYNPRHGSEARILEPKDLPAFQRFLSECPAEEVDVSSLAPDQTPVAGIFVAGKIAAAASYEILEGIVAHIGVLSHPSFRGKGYGVQAVSAITKTLIEERRYGVQYRTLLNNHASVASGRKVGFKDYAQTIALRLHKEVST